MEGKTIFSRRLKQFDGLTWVTLTPVFYDRSMPLTEPGNYWQTRYVQIHEVNWILHQVMNYADSDERRHRPTVRYYEYFYSPMKAAHNAHT